jgi:putative sigma-54 modulation protein
VDVRVHGKNMQVTDDLRDLAVDKVAHAGRILDDGGVTDVEFAEHQNPRVSDGRYRVEITARAVSQVIRVEASAQDDRSALDAAVDKFERQLRRLKERLIQRNRQPANKFLNEAPTGDEEEEHEGPRITRTKRFSLKPMTPEEAALQMEMLGHNFFFFLNADTDAYAVLYARRDGSLGLIETE